MCTCMQYNYSCEVHVSEEISMVIDECLQIQHVLVYRYNMYLYCGVARISGQQVSDSADQAQMVICRRAVAGHEAVQLHMPIEVAAQISHCAGRCQC